jgi:hypothetical protein
MDEKLLLSSYIVKIKDKEKKYQLMDKIGGTRDFLETFNEFTEFIFQNIEKLEDYGSKHTIHLTLESPATIDDSDGRSIYGFFASGVSGERFKVIDTNTNEKEMDVKPHHAAFRNIFFYLYVPRLKNKAYLILQRKSKFGIKGKLNESLSKYLKTNGLHNYRLEINNVLHNKVYEKMMKHGNLKKVELIKNRIPGSLEKYMDNNQELEEIKGTFKSSFSSGISLPKTWKDFIDKIFKQTSPDGNVEIPELDNDYDDLEFELELNGKKKTFYMVKQHRIQPDIDVTQNLEIVDGEPTIDSLLVQSQEIVDDIIKII